MKIKTTGRLFALATAALVLAGCASGLPHVNPYKDTPVGSYFSGDVIPPASYFKAQTQVVAPHCEQFAKETNPQAGTLANAMAANHGVAGLVGGAGGMAADLGVTNNPITAPLVLGSGLYYSAAAGTQSYATGLESADQQVFQYKKYCIIANTGGYRSVTQKELDEISKTGISPTLQKVIEVSPAPKDMAPPPSP